MDDMISRAAAIEYLMTNMGWRDEDGYEVDDADEKRAIITDLLNGVPAVDAAPVIRCASCKWWNGSRVVIDRDKAINGLERFIADLQPYCGNEADWRRVYDALALLKEWTEGAKG